MAELWLTVVITSIVFGYAGNAFAKKTDRNILGWTVAGVVLNVLILCAMLVVGGRSAKAKQFVR